MVRNTGPRHFQYMKNLRVFFRSGPCKIVFPVWDPLLIDFFPVRDPFRYRFFRSGTLYPRFSGLGPWTHTIFSGLGLCIFRVAFSNIFFWWFGPELNDNFGTFCRGMYAVHLQLNMCIPYSCKLNFATSILTGVTYKMFCSQ